MRSYISGFQLLKSVALLSLLPVLPMATHAQEEAVEFDSSFFSFSSETMDVARFKRSEDFVPAGDYDVGVFVNGQLKGKSQLEYVEVADNRTELCVTPQLVEVLDLKEEAYGLMQKSKCQDSVSYLPEAKIDLDRDMSALTVEVPQTLTMVRSRSHAPDHLRKTSTPSAFIDYNISSYNYKQKDKKSDGQYLYLNGGMNIGDWSLHHTGSLSRQDGKKDSYQRGITYLKKDIDSLDNELIFGDFATEGSIVESVPMRGAMVRTDVAVPSRIQQDYAPRVRGVANVNATVIIRQNGMVIYQTSVPAGPFEINDLYPTGYSGELIAEVYEADGNVQRFVVPYVAPVSAMRSNKFAYQLAGGAYRNGNLVLPSERVWAGSVQYGWSDDVTLNGGFIAHDKYRSKTLGATTNTKYGAISGGVTRSVAKLGDSQKSEYGTSVQAAYHLRIAPTKTNITLSGRHNFSERSYALDEAIAIHQMSFEENGAAMIQKWHTDTLRPKNRYQLTMSQQLQDGWGSVYLSGAMSNYWNHKDRDIDYQFSYGNRYKGIGYNVGISQHRQADDHKVNRQVFASLSIPLDFGSLASSGGKKRLVHSNTSYATDTKGSHLLRQSLSGFGGEHNQYGYGLSVESSAFDTSTAMSASYQSSNVGRFDVSYTNGSDDVHQLSLGASGVVAAHSKGVVFSDTVSGAFGLIHAKNGAGASSAYGLNKTSGVFGNAMAKHSASFAYSHTGIDPAQLPMNAEFDAVQSEMALPDKSVMATDVSVHQGATTLILPSVDELKRSSFGMAAMNAKRNSIGAMIRNASSASHANHTSDRRIADNLESKANESHASDVCRFNWDVASVNQKSVKNTTTSVRQIKQHDPCN